MLYSLIDLLCCLVFALPLSWLLLAFCGNGNKKRFVLLGLFTIYMCEMFDVVGIPAVSYIRREPSINLIPFGDEKNYRFFFQIGLNALMFLPFGFFLPVLWSKYRRWYRTILAGFLTSLTIELLQMFYYRATDVDDLIMNTLGAFLGYLIALVCFRKKWEREAEPDTGRLSQWGCLPVSILIPLLVIVFLRTPLSNRIYALRIFRN